MHFEDRFNCRQFGKVLLSMNEIERRMAYHAIKPGQQALYESNRALFKEMAYYIENLGRSRESSLALTALQESLMWVNAHIACNDIGVEKENDDA